MMIATRSESATRRNEIGVTLSELLVVLALIGMIVLFGGPALGNAYRSYKARASANELTTILRAVRYTAVAERTPRTLTLNNQGDPTNPNTYTYIDKHGKTVLVRLHEGVNLETGSDASITFNINGGTGQTGPQVVLISTTVNGNRGDRYTVSVNPTGSVSSTYSTYTP